jgi:hypothetical protein
LARAEAAIAIPHRISLDIRVKEILWPSGLHTGTALPGRSSSDTMSTTGQLKEWTLSCAGRAMAMRTFISEHGRGAADRRRQSFVLDQADWVIDSARGQRSMTTPTAISRWGGL